MPDELVVAPAPTPRARGLSTARAVLQVLSLLARSPQGLRAQEVADALGKSPSTAYNLLDSLCEEHFAVHDRGRYRLAGAPPPLTGAATVSPRAGLTEALDELFAQTHKRAYLAEVRHGRIAVTLVRGQQGMRRIPGMGAEITRKAHALAIGKVVLAQLDDAGLARYVGDGLPAFTPETIVDGEALARTLEAVRRTGVATDREEFEADTCCLAAPVLCGGRAVAAIGISMPLRAFDREREELSGLLLDVARRAELPAIAEEAPRSCIAPPRAPSVALPAEMEVSA